MCALVPGDTVAAPENATTRLPMTGKTRTLPPPPETGRIDRLEVGDPVPDLGWVDTNGARVSLGQSVNAGRLTILVAGSQTGLQAGEPSLRTLRAAMPRLAAAGARAFAIHPGAPGEGAGVTARLDLPFPVLFDAAFALGRALGHMPRSAESAIVLVDPNQRVLRLFLGDQAQAAVAFATDWLAAHTARVVTTQAPVLLVPNVLSPEHCARVVHAWETGQRYEGGVAGAEGGNVPVAKVKIREDVALADTGSEAQELFSIFRRRLLPQIRKAFNYRVTRAETLRIGCYAAEDGGHFIPHRDDTTPYSAHRRFAMSLNLNAGDYEGGYLTFPEFGPELYSPPTGGAIVFSCSLLHEATRITAGRRYVLLGFFYGEAEQALRERLRTERRG